MSFYLSNQTKVILIGGSSHTGKSTLGISLAKKLGWSYLSTDKLARHPGRPWVTSNGKIIPENVAQHYRNLSIKALFLDVLSHYQKNVFSQIETIVHSHVSKLATECLVMEGSALWPEFVANLITKNSVRAVWLTASDRFLCNRIKHDSNFDSLGWDEKYLVQKFLARTLLFNKIIKKEVERLGLTYIDVENVESVSLTEEFDWYFSF
jgi:shikimate kinase